MASLHLTDSHPAFEHYCVAIFELKEDEIDVIQARIADRLGVSRPAVSEMIRRLETEGLVTLEDRIQLTEAGEELAEKVVRKPPARRSGSSPTSSGCRGPRPITRPTSGSTSSPTRSSCRSTSSWATRPPARTATPSPGRRYEPPDYVPLNQLARATASPSPASPKSSSSPRGCSSSSRTPRWSPEARAGSPQPLRTARSRSTSTARPIGIGAFASARILVLRNG